MRLFAGTWLALVLATSLFAQQDAATNASSASTASSATQPATSAPATPPDNVILERQTITVQKLPLAVPIAVGAPAQATPPPTAASVPAPQAAASRQPAGDQASGQAAPAAASAQPDATPGSAAGQEPGATAASSAQQAEPGAAPPSVQPGTAIFPNVSKKQAQEAKRQFEVGVKLKEKGKLDEAFSKFSSASELDPTKLDYITAREFTREQLAYQALQRGNKAMNEHNEIVAMAEFRRALDYDPTNSYALQRLRDAIPADQVTDHPISVVEQSLPIDLRPTPQHHDFHFRGDSRALLTEITRAYGIKAQFDDSVKQQRVFYDIQDVNFAKAMETAVAVTKTFWVSLTSTQILFLADTVENRRNFERLGLQTFYLPDLSDQQLAEMTNSLRVLLNLRYIALDKEANTISIRAELPHAECRRSTAPQSFHRTARGTARPERLCGQHQPGALTGHSPAHAVQHVQHQPGAAGGTGRKRAEPDQPAHLLRRNQCGKLHRDFSAAGAVTELNHQFHPQPALRHLRRRTDVVRSERRRHGNHADLQPEYLRHPGPGAPFTARLAQRSGGGQDRRALSGHQRDLRTHSQQCGHLFGHRQPELHRAFPVV